jgi:hypothetical protein
LVVVSEERHRKKSEGAHETDCGAVAKPEGKRAAKHLGRV